MNKSKKGISLIVLVVTIVVIIILVATVLYNITDGKIFGVANESVFKNDLRIIEEEFEMFVQTKAAQSVGKFEIESLNAADDGLTYNTKTNEKETNIYDVIPTAKKGYYSEFEIIKGELYYKGDVEQKLIWAKELGIGIIPYEIVDGVLISANSNLLLLDSTGTVRIPYNVTKIGEGVFNNLEGLTRVIIPGSVKEIGRNAFSNNTSLQEVIMEDGVEIIGEQAFYQCSNLQIVKLGNTIKEIKTSCFRGCKKLENINLPDSITSIGSLAFAATNLKEVELPENLSVIGSEVFSSCMSLQKINIPPLLREINIGVFSGCRNLNYIDTSKSNYFSFENNCLYSKDFKTLKAVTGNATSIHINPLTEAIESAVFNRSGVKEVYIPASVKTIGKEYTFGTYKMDKLVVDSANPYFISLDNDLYSKNYEILYKCNKTGNVKVKEGVKQVIRGTFISTGEVTSIELPESLEIITGHAAIPSSVTYLYIPKSVTNIAAISIEYVKEIDVSKENTKYKSIDNKYLVSKDGKTLYFATNTMTNINDIPKTIEVIGQYAFYSHTRLVEVKLNAPIKEIKNNAFDNCTSLKKIEIADTIQKIGDNAFGRTNNLTEIIIHKQRGEISGAPWGSPYGMRVINWLK